MNFVLLLLQINFEIAYVYLHIDRQIDRQIQSRTCICIQKESVKEMCKGVRVLHGPGRLGKREKNLSTEWAELIKKKKWIFQRVGQKKKRKTNNILCQFSLTRQRRNFYTGRKRIILDQTQATTNVNVLMKHVLHYWIINTLLLLLNEFPIIHLNSSLSKKDLLIFL